MLRARLNRLQARSVGPLVRALTRRHAALYLRFGGRRFGTYYRKPVLVLSTTGRRSGQQRATPVVYMPDGDRWLVAPTNSGLDRAPAWWLNLQARPEAEVQIGEQRYPVRARVAEGDERSRLWASMSAYNHEWADYTRLTRREIPIIVFERR
jgi:F420H(2)-dependent quinone reductase